PCLLAASFFDEAGSGLRICRTPPILLLPRRLLGCTPPCRRTLFLGLARQIGFAHPRGSITGRVLLEHEGLALGASAGIAQRVGCRPALLACLPAGVLEPPVGASGEGKHHRGGGPTPGMARFDVGRSRPGPPRVAASALPCL